MEEQQSPDPRAPRSARRRFRDARPGSILIMVVALLVLMALLGTAYLVAARGDRASAEQHGANTQVDLLVDGVVNMAKSVVADDLYDNSAAPYAYRPAVSSTYDHWDCPQTVPANGGSAPYDLWLGDRIPVQNATGTIVWNALSWPLASNASGGGYQFDCPNSGTPHGLSLPKGQFAPAPSIVLNGQKYPTLQEYNGTTAIGTPFIAADADGDGVPDAGLVRMPVGQINGVSYYYAARVIDNNSAINVNTAWGANKDFAGGDDAGTLTNNGYFPANVGLRELLYSFRNSGSASEIDNLNIFRFGYGNIPGPAYCSLTAVDDTNAQRTDFSFMSQSDAFYMQSGRRLDNPGYNVLGRKYYPFAWADASPLAYRFCLKDSSASPGVLEGLLPNSIANSNPANPCPISTMAYAPDDYATWYANNFNYTASNFNIRPLLVTRNGVSNEMRPVYAPSTITVNGNTTSTDYNNDGLKNDPLRDITAYNDNPTAMLPYNGAVQARASVNTATFEELWRNYWCVMAGTTSTDPYTASRAPYTHGQHMFRSTIRDVAPFNSSTEQFAPQQMLQLRSALAAVNLIALRSGSSDVVSKSLQTDVQGNYKGNKGVYSTIYSIAPQPYITEIYVNTDIVKSVGGKTNPAGYYAIELYNPYPNPISLYNWQIAMGRLTLSTLANFSTQATAPVVPANGYLVLENYRAAAAGTDAKYRPAGANAQAASATCSYYYVAGLNGVADDEAIILRPRRADGTLSSGNDGRNYNEGSNNYELVPVDQFDFTGFPAAAVGKCNLLHYVRANGAGNAWKFVYPGRYDGAKTQQRQDGTQQTNFTAGTADPALTTPAVLGGSDGAASYSPTFVIPLNPSGWTSNPAGLSGNKFPFGAFAKNGDLLQVPFIGAYRIAVRQDNGNDKLKSILEVNSVTTDAAFADDADPSDDAEECVGRFCPLSSDLRDDRAGRATAGSTTTLVDPGRQEPTNYFVGYSMTITAGIGVGQTRGITAYDASTHAFTVAPAFATAPASGSTYLVSRDVLGSVTSATSTTLTDNNRNEANGTWVGWDLSIVSGPGTGQSQIVSAFTGHVLTVPIAWATTPTSASTYKLTRQRYAWAAKLFDYFSVLSPNDDYLPNIDPNAYPPGTFAVWKTNTNYVVGNLVAYGTVNYQCTVAHKSPSGVPAASYWTTNWTTVATAPQAVANSDPTIANSNLEDPIPIEGLVNINTAPWKVLSMLPMAQNGDGTVNTAANNLLAKAIVNYRAAAGPFQSIDDLNKVVDFTDTTKTFQNGYGTLTVNLGDFQQKFLVVNRISNMITTRSDTFTVYILVQGWRGVPNTPTLVVQRRVAFVCDRSRLNLTNKILRTLNVPVN